MQTIARRLRRRQRRFQASLTVLAVLLAGFLPAWTAELPPPEFSPQGSVKDIAQVTARFAAPMIALGDPRAPSSPFAIDCAVPGTERWVDSRTWAYDFERTLPGGVTCRFTLADGLSALDGEKVAGGAVFEVSTGGPAIVTSIPSDDTKIEETQAFLLRLDAEAVPSSVEEHAWFGVDGIGDKIGVRILSGADRDAILATLPQEARQGAIMILQARQTFPPEAKVRLVWGKGIAAESGLARTEDQVLSFTVRPPFRAELACTQERPQSPCVPLSPIELRFSSPVAWEKARGAALVFAKQRFSPETPDSPDGFVTTLTFRGPFEASTTAELEVPKDLPDDAGRPLANADQFPRRVEIGPDPPLAKFAARFGILEAKADPALPITVRNLGRAPNAQSASVETSLKAQVLHLTAERSHEIVPWLERVASARREQSIFAARSGPLRDLAVPIPGAPGETEVLGIPLAEPGLYVVEVASRPLGEALLGKPEPMYVTAAALVTNLAVHLKWGNQSSLAWVTSLDKAQPVGSAEVRVHDCTGRVLWQGKTDAQGLARMGALPSRSDLPSCSYPYGEPDPFRDYRGNQPLNGLGYGLFVTARLGNDISFVFSEWDDGIESWRFGIQSGGYSSETVVGHTILARNLLRAGQPVHMKHVLRRETDAGFALVAAEERPTRVTIRHQGSDTSVDLPLTWAEDGTAETVWTIPPSAKLGTYDVTLVRPAPEAAPSPTPAKVPAGMESVYYPTRYEQSWDSGTFRVEEFRVPLMQAAVKLPAEAQVRASRIPVDVSVRYLAGGGAAEMPIVLRSRIRELVIDPPEGLGDYSFGNGAVAVGVKRERGYTEPSEDAQTPAIHQRERVVLDAEGTARAWITDLPSPTKPEQLVAEIEFRDPNGEIQTSSSSVPLWPAAFVPGIKIDNWTGTGSDLSIHTAVIDPSGKPVANAEVQVTAFSRRYDTNRIRVVAGFYAYESIEETRRLNSLCQGRTDAAGRFSCSRRPPGTGQLVLQATVRGADGAESSANTSVWIEGSSELGFEASDADRMELVPERRRYEPGETARLQVRAPFARSTALVTVEREGVIDARVQELGRENPVIEVPVDGKLSPNAFVSVLAVRGRVSRPRPTARLDLGKPAIRLGIAELQVGWDAHRLAVEVRPEREVYRVREKARVNVSVRTPEGGPPPTGSNIAVAAVDEGLLELSPNPSWNLLRAMMRTREENVSTASSNLQVIGKRHFGRKAARESGGGGRKTTRELLDTLLLWQARVPLDERGEATLEIPLNDSLTSFRIVAVALGDERFGTGDATIRSTQDLMLFSGLPPLARSGDRLWSEITVRNTTDQAMDVRLSAEAEGLTEPLAPQQVQLAAAEARTLGWETVVPAGVAELAWQFEASAAGGDSDRLRIVQKVVPAVPVRTMQASLLRYEPPGPLREPVERPADAIPGRGGVRVALAASLSDGLTSVRDWMRAYPYTCLEQRVSRAIALGDDALWTSIVDSMPSHLDDDGLLKFFPTMDAGSDELTSYVLAISIAAGRALPTDLEQRLEDGLVAFVEGRIAGESSRGSDLPLRKLSAIAALARAGVARADLSSSITIEPSLWPTPALIDWWRILLDTQDIADRNARLAEVEQLMRARLYVQGTTLTVSTPNTPAPSWLLSGSGADTLRLILLLIDGGKWKEDVPRLVRGALGEQRKGAWSTTVANAWGVVALGRFSAALEAEPVKGTTRVALDQDVQQLDWLQDPRGKTLDFAWPNARNDLVVEQTGAGLPWVTVQALAAVPLREPLSSGFTIRKTVEPVEPRPDGKLQVGDVLRVRLEIEAATDAEWVVVDDPVPTGASYLAGAPDGDPNAGAADEPSPAFVERGFEAYRAYYSEISRGKFSLEYAIRLNQSGELSLPPSRVEALYAPESFGEIPNAALHVGR